eukprot:MONOS_5674.1-p1 / transcript=MONOS_5674.1 / gene=MONOS_5674 / organism=Monocercomonoides_exilis_PA203 / gene_product=unspecified product / transcript_product=unspecified product / location=Mono_scaffold00168:26119-26690(+) / protein_length=139 / sequence_SO=supercontig / SO=protein_coding / is_pseudo=false
MTRFHRTTFSILLTFIAADVHVPIAPILTPFCAFWGLGSAIFQYVFLCIVKSPEEKQRFDDYRLEIFSKLELVKEPFTIQQPAAHASSEIPQQSNAFSFSQPNETFGNSGYSQPFTSSPSYDISSSNAAQGGYERPSF